MARSILSLLRSIRPFDAILLLASLCTYLFLAYEVNREYFPLFIACITFLFVSSFLLYRSYSKKRISFGILLFGGLLFRLVFLFSEPRLSDDYKRYIWDGVLINHSIDPYAYRPSEIDPRLTKSLGDWQQLALQKDYYSLYPPIPQLAFAIAARASKNSLRIFILHLITFLLEAGSILLIIRTLPLLHLPRKRSLFYILNPLPIIELSGNLHIEGFMIIFTLLAAYFFYRKKVIRSGLSLSAAVLSKFLPILFVPAFLKWPFNQKQAYFLLGVFLPIILFLSLLNPTSGEHILNSTSLYFNTFEFNGSFYSLIRWIGYKVKGYNVIREIAPWLTFSTALLMISISVIHLIRPFRSVFIFFTLTLTIYFLLATTVNPWYIAPILAFGLFTPYHYPLAWSFLVFLSYQAFSTPDFNVPPILLIGEYGFLFLIMAIDYISNKNEINSENPNSLSR